MGKIISTIKYGSAKTRVILILVLVLILAGAVGFVLGIVNFNLLYMGAGCIGLVAGLVILLTAFVGVEIDSEESASPAKSTSSAGNDKKLNDRANGTFEVSGDSEIVEIEFDGYKVVPEVSKEDSGRKQTGKNRQSDKNGQSDRNRQSGRDTNVKAKVEAEYAHSGRPKSFADSDTAAQAVAYYTKKTYRSVLRKCKVRKNYVPIMIDSCSAFDTAQTPALCWSKKDKVSFLLFEGNERVVTMPMSSFLNVTYKRNSPVANVEGYEAMKQMEIYETFADVMPTYDSSTNRMGLTTFTQNLYVLGRDLAITPRSLRSLRSKYQFKYDIFKALDVRGEYSMYFKKAYEMRILWTDNVIGQQDYQSRIRGILESMVQDSDLLRYEFEEEMNQMIQYRLITREYADYYLAQHSKMKR